MADFLRDVRCRGCRRLLGVAKYDNTIYCDAMCATDFPAQSTEARDALVEAIYLTQGKTYADLGKTFGFSRQMAQQIIARRDIRKVA
ncbi:hypothetical protein PV336_15785 [Streptomyces sp. MI02-2A]|uniref:hypothetical protein n=1 Tax=Streptomyces sp. MI02-2A TaxID=3028688 RepID=UPI0029A7EECB|nr:hypothetical protein [Streptomyces sp. MI02-2A]MDX3260680.1 hypothetical protein [Streptomyces sp. MI02-2A]